MSGTLALASAIAAMDREALERLVRLRRPVSPASIVDPIGLAAALLRADSLAQALVSLDSETLRALQAFSATAGGDPAQLSARVAAVAGEVGLVGLEHGAAVALPEVSEALSSAFVSAGIDPESLPDAPILLPNAPQDTATWYVPAVTAVAQAAECLRALRGRPGRRNRSGTIAVTTVRTLADATRIEADSVVRTLEALVAAGLIGAGDADPATLAPTPAASAWLDRDQSSRWLQLVRAVVDRMPRELRALPGLIGAPIAASASEPGPAPVAGAIDSRGSADLAAALEALPRWFPLLTETQLTAAGDFVSALEHLGATVQGVLCEVGVAVFEADFVRARDLASSQIPAVVPGVYVQPDLSVVIPGPLAPADEAELCALTLPDQVGIASTRRITESSVAEAYEQGISPEAARSALERLSLTGIPQPLDYLLRSLTERVGSIVVREYDGDEGRTRVTVSRPELAATLSVDRALHHLQLEPLRTSRPVTAAAGSAVSTDRTAPGAGAGASDPASAAPPAPVELVSKLRIDHVLAAFSDARYHAVRAVTAPLNRAAAPDTEPVRSSGAESAAAVTPIEPCAEQSGSRAVASTDSDAFSSLADRVHRAARDTLGESDFIRRLELAIRDRSPVRVTAEARGQSRSFVLLPVSVNAGRLRATDQGAGVERTLPVHMITAVDPV